MAQDPRETFAKYQRQLQARLRSGGNGGLPGAGAAAGGLAGFGVLVGLGLLYSSLYNG